MRNTHESKIFAHRPIAVTLLLLFLGSMATAQTETVLYSFAGGTGSGHPGGGLARDDDGNLYGVSEGDCGSYAGYGTVFKLSPQGAETVLYTFTADSSDGAWPTSLVRAESGALYGVTRECDIIPGTLFEINPAGKFSVVYTFESGEPTGNLILDSEGNLYGTTDGPDYGSIYKMSPSGVETTLYTFTSTSDGWQPDGTLLRDAAGNLYGSTAYGGSGSCTYGCGVVFELASNGSFSVLYSFTGGTDGAEPDGDLIQDAQGNLYGTTFLGGGTTSCQTTSCGVVFELSPSGVLTVLHAFQGTDGANPGGGLLRDGNGNLYGTARNEGARGVCTSTIGCGVVFMLSPDGNERTLHNFTGGADGGAPDSPLLIDASGNLYGTTTFGGVDDYYGVVYKLTP
jgi:uncharacterized repeat protein (TIGR03803 family)